MPPISRTTLNNNRVRLDCYLAMSISNDTTSRLSGWWGWRQPPPPQSKRAAQSVAATELTGHVTPDSEQPLAEQPKASPPKAKPAKAAPVAPPPPEVRAQSLQLVWGPGEVAPGGKTAHLALGELLDIEPGVPIIEIGCGLGGFARIAAANFDANVTATDFDPMLVGIAQSLPKNPAVKIVTSTHTPFSIDAGAAARIVARSAIGSGDAASMLESLKGLLVPGGRIALLEFCCPSDDRATRDKLAKHGVKAADLNSILAAAETAGLTVVSTEDGTQSLINSVVAGWTKVEPLLAAGSLPPPVVTVLSEEAVKWAQLCAVLTKNGARFHTIMLDAPAADNSAKSQPADAENRPLASLLTKYGVGRVAGKLSKVGKLFRRR